MVESFKIRIQDLNQPCFEHLFDFEDTSHLTPLDSIIGQERAVQAIDFGLNMKGEGYNIFVTGLAGTGKSTILKKLLTDQALTENTSQDLCLVNNFDDAYCPDVIEMPPGTAVYFSRSMTRISPCPGKNSQVLKKLTGRNWKTGLIRWMKSWKLP